MACGAAHSAKLLLMSANDKHHHGLANGLDQVGRNYMFNTSQAVLAISKEPNPTYYQKTLGLKDFYFGMEGYDFPVGSIQMVGKSQTPMYRGEKPIETILAPTWVLDKSVQTRVGEINPRFHLWLDDPLCALPGNPRLFHRRRPKVLRRIKINVH